MKRQWLVWAFIVLGTLALGPLLYAILNWSSSEEDQSIDFNNYSPLAAKISQANKVALFEGLPHHVFEYEILERELKRRDILKIRSYPFYQEKLLLSAEDASKLTRLFCDEKNFGPNRAFVLMGYRTRNPAGSVTKIVKACGGFHPDYCVEWDVQGNVYQMLICFGCEEIKCFGPSQQLYCDVGNAGLKQFGEVLKKYRKNRPATQWWP